MSRTLELLGGLATRNDLPVEPNAINGYLSRDRLVKVAHL